MDTTAHALVAAHTLYARAGSSSSTESRPAIYKVIGIILAVCSGLFIGVSFVLKKMGLLKANAKYNEEAGEGYGYLKNAWWWTGMTLMIIGEICNFVAYAFVDAILVTPLGALSVVVTTILSAIFLKERLSFVGKVGCFNCIIGSVVIVVNAPAQSSAATIQEMQHYVIAPGFLSYAGVVIVGSAFTAFWAGPRYGKKSMLVYLTICSLVGGLSVVATQGLGAAIVTQISGTPQFNQWFLYVLLVFVIATLLTEIIYLNKALNIFNAALVTPTYYVYFTSATIVTSAILFRGFHGTAQEIATVVMGFLQICAGVVLLQLAKSSKDVPDAAVFKGDLDQVRTMAEQEEPESEPRADTIRGGGALLRALSRSRTKRQAEEVATLHSERMEPIGEDEQVEWDGLRRRKTVLAPGQSSLQRSKTVHPPLGMAYFPGDETSTISEADTDADVHPGFFPRFGRSLRKNSTTLRNGRGSPSPVPLGTVMPNKTSLDREDSHDRDHIYGLPPGLRKETLDSDTSYKGGGGGYPSDHVHFSASVDERDRVSSQGSSLAPPRPPPHGALGGAKRQFSFQNVFHRRRSDDHVALSSGGGGGGGDGVGLGQRPTSSNRTLSFGSRKASAQVPGRGTEEERAGLVKGDSGLPLYGEGVDEEEEWRRSDSPDEEQDLGQRRRMRDDYDEYDHDSDDLYGEPRREF